MILDYLNTITSQRFNPSVECLGVYSDRPVYSHVDYLKATTPNQGDFQGFIKKFMPLLKGYGFNFYDRGCGFNGYDVSWFIQFNEENCGTICADSKGRMGGLFELTGKGCQVMQIRWDLWNRLVIGLSEFGLALTRVDVASDFKGKVWDKRGINMLDMARFVDKGMFKVGSGQGHVPTVQTVGPWLELIINKVKDYKPLKHCLGGLTLNVGKSTSTSMFCIYEKGKQLAGKNPDRYDGSLSSWIRVERRFGRGSGRSERVIPHEFALYPDRALVYECAGLEEFVSDWLDFQSLEGVVFEPVSSESVDMERVGHLKSVSLKRTAIHVGSQVGRFLRTLVELGIDLMDFCERVIHDNPTRGFDPAFHAGSSLNDWFGPKKVDPCQFGIAMFTEEEVQQASVFN